MNGDYYAVFLTRARQVVIEKKRGKLAKRVLFLQDDAQVRTERVASHALAETKFEGINHPSFEGKDSEYFFTGLKAIYGKCKKCIEAKGDYIEKLIFYTFLSAFLILDSILFNRPSS